MLTCLVADALSRRPEEPGWEPPEEPEEDVDGFIDAALNNLNLVVPRNDWLSYAPWVANISFEEYPLDETYSEQSQQIARWILFRKRPEGLSKGELAKFKKKALQFDMRERYLFQRPSGGRPLRRVIDDQESKQKILQALHEESGHRGKEGTWRKIWTRYYWKGLYDDVKKHVQTCREFQVYSDTRSHEALHPTEPPLTPWTWVTIDVVFMPGGLNGKSYLIIARDYTSQWPEARALAKNDSRSISKFIEECICCRWGAPLKISCDGGSENKGLVIDLQKQYGIQRVVSSAHHPQGQGMIERGHKVIVAALKKMTGNWVLNLPQALWADRVTVKRSTGETPACLIGGKEHVLPIELSLPTWQTLPWEQVTDTPSLLAMRAEQFRKRDVHLQEAIDRTIRLRHQNKEYFDDAKRIRSDQLAIGDLVLLRDSPADADMSTIANFRPKWRGPYRISFVGSKGWYKLQELDGVPFRSHTPGDRVKKFYPRAEAELIEATRRWEIAEQDTQHEQNQEQQQARQPVGVQVRIPKKADFDPGDYQAYSEEELSEGGDLDSQ